MPLTSDLSDQFFEDLVDMCGRLQCDPLDLLGVMMAESAVKAAARNPSSDASGLIQFLPSTLAHLGWTGTTAAFRQLSADQQLRYVEAYFQPYVHYNLDTAARVYQVVFLPSSLTLGESFNTVIAQKDGINPNVYDSNRGLDANFDGKITLGELQQAIERHFNDARWQEIAQRLDAVDGAESRPSNPGGTGGGGNQGGGAGAIDLRTQSGVSEALEALGFDRKHYSYAAAVRAFQQRSGLSTDGVVGPRTRASLTTALDDNGIAFTV
jgi:hypothetical protein